MSNPPTIRLQQANTYAAKIAVIGRDTIVAGAFDRIFPQETVNVFFFDTPSVDPDCTLEEYVKWLDRQFDGIDLWAAKDAILILCPTDRKGHSWSKSATTVCTATACGWQLFRHFVWQKQEADFHRSHYAFQDVWVLRRGNRPMNAEAAIRYKDVVKFNAPTDHDSEIGVIPEELVAMFLDLVIQPDDVVMDPFAGRGSVMRACHQFVDSNVRSISVELDPGRAEQLVALATSLKAKEGL